MALADTDRDCRRALLGGLIDHAPLFPPASLPLEEALEDHRRALASRQSWMVARFVCPASRLSEIESEELRLSLVLDIDPAQVRPDERVEAVESAKYSADSLKMLAPEAYLEIPPEDRHVTSVWAHGVRAKIRCGPEPPPATALARFIRACRSQGVPFKATAGLHHALPANGQHGFLNLLAAAVFGDEEAALSEADPGAFSLGESFAWRGREAGPEEVARVRRELFTSIGSCSFFEPVEELKALGLL